MGERNGLQVIPGGRVERPEPLWREVLGERLRALRQERRSTLADTAGRAGISPQYLSEVERGRKEPSSEMIAALAGALDTSVGALVGQVADAMRTDRRITAQRQTVRQAALPTGSAVRPVLHGAGLLLAA